MFIPDQRWFNQFVRRPDGLYAIQPLHASETLVVCDSTQSIIIAWNTECFPNPGSEHRTLIVAPLPEFLPMQGDGNDGLHVGPMRYLDQLLSIPTSYHGDDLRLVVVFDLM